MTHTIINEKLSTKLSVIEKDSSVIIEVTWMPEGQTTNHELSKKDLHSFIGTLLHVQSKLKK